MNESAYRADSMEDVLLMLASKHGRHVQVVKGQWGFSQGSGYIPTTVYLTLVQAVAEEAKMLRATADIRWGEANRLAAAGDALSADADLIDALTLPAIGASRQEEVEP